MNPIVHFVRDEDFVLSEDPSVETRVTAVCGARCYLDVVTGAPAPSSFDFVIGRDPRCLVDCWPCLVRLSLQEWIRVEAQIVESGGR